MASYNSTPHPLLIIISSIFPKGQPYHNWNTAAKSEFEPKPLAPKQSVITTSDKTIAPPI